MLERTQMYTSVLRPQYCTQWPINDWMEWNHTSIIGSDKYERLTLVLVSIQVFLSLCAFVCMSKCNIELNRLLSKVEHWLNRHCRCRLTLPRNWTELAWPIFGSHSYTHHRHLCVFLCSSWKHHTQQSNNNTRKKKEKIFLLDKRKNERTEQKCVN